MEKLERRRESVPVYVFVLAICAFTLLSQFYTIFTRLGPASIWHWLGVVASLILLGLFIPYIGAKNDQFHLVEDELQELKKFYSRFGIDQMTHIQKAVDAQLAFCADTLSKNIARSILLQKGGLDALGISHVETENLYQKVEGELKQNIKLWQHNFYELYDLAKEYGVPMRPRHFSEYVSKATDASAT